MTVTERDAFAALRLDWVRSPDDVWRASPFHVDGINAGAARMIKDAIDQATDDMANPMGLVIQGQAGAGKTHLLGWVREQVHRAGGYFILIGPLSGKAFWESVASSVVDSLMRRVGDGKTQLTAFLDRLSVVIGAPPEVARAITGQIPLERNHLKDLIVALRTYDRVLGRECEDTLRALVLYSCGDFESEDVARAYLLSMEEQVPQEREIRGMRPDRKAAVDIVRELSRLLALTGPTVIAVDQIDTVVAETMVVDEETGERRGDAVFHQLADGLLVLRDSTVRTVCVVACLPTTWALFRDEAVRSVVDRFREIGTLNVIGSRELAEAMVAKRFAERYSRIGFTPPYPTWPVHPKFFGEAVDLTPRQLLQQIDRHVQSCLARSRFTELAGLEPVLPPPPPPPPPDKVDRVFAELDAWFEELRGQAGGLEVLTADNEDVLMPQLLSAGLNAWIQELGPDAAGQFEVDGSPSPKAPLHARLRRMLDETTGREQHWSFRAVTHRHAIAALTRLRAACTNAGIADGGAGRKLFILRNAEWSKGAQTQAVLKEFTAAGGRTVPLTDDDLRTLTALQRMLDERHPHLPDWLAARRPAGSTPLLKRALGGVRRELAAKPVPAPAATAPPATAGTPAAPSAATPTADRSGPSDPPGPGDGGGGGGASGGSGGTPVRTPGGGPPGSGPPGGRGSGGASRMQLPGAATDDRISFPVGTSMLDGGTVRVALEDLRRHTVIFAGSGSGKTVLIRRLVEECALRGVSSIVLDPNNDLARLGEPWPQEPGGWGSGDAELARRYLADTDVVIWTPRRQSGRPLVFQTLPDFTELRDDPDELEAAIDTAASTLAEQAGVTGRTRRAVLGQAILRQAVAHFAKGSRTTLESFIDLLAELPDGVTDLDPDGRIAAELAQTLKAKKVTDPLFGGRGEVADPAELLTPAPGKKARVSVVSLVGLPDDEQRQSFVGQLQMALFAWAKKHPAGDRPLGALLVMDEAQTFAPSGANTPCTKSTLALASQARKYGLGLVFATQAPKGLHNRIPGNASTQFFGKLTSPVQIDAAREMAKAQGGDAPDIGRLKVGEFYAAGVGFSFGKLRTPLCLTHHPRSPLSVDEVVERARKSRR